MDKTYRRFVANAVHNLGCSCSRAESFDEAIALFERSLQFREVGPGYMFLTSAHVKNGDPAGALDVLRRMHQSPSSAVQRWLFLGEGSRWFYEDEAFIPVREDGDFVELVGGNFKDDATIR